MTVSVESSSRSAQRLNKFSKLFKRTDFSFSAALLEESSLSLLLIKPASYQDCNFSAEPVIATALSTELTIAPLALSSTAPVLSILPIFKSPVTSALTPASPVKFTVPPILPVMSILSSDLMLTLPVVITLPLTISPAVRLRSALEPTMLRFSSLALLFRFIVPEPFAVTLRLVAALLSMVPIVASILVVPAVVVRLTFFAVSEPD